MFLNEPDTPEAAQFLERERASSGYVMNLERAWAWRPDVADAFMQLRKQLMDGSTLSPREFAILVCVTARTAHDPHCSLAWGSRLARLAGPAFAADVLRGVSSPEMTAREVALRDWAEQMVRDPNGATAADIARLRAAGLSDKEVFEASAFIGFRLAFSTINDALGAPPDRQLVDEAPPEVSAAVTYGRAPMSG